MAIFPHQIKLEGTAICELCGRPAKVTVVANNVTIKGDEVSKNGKFLLAKVMLNEGIEMIALCPCGWTKRKWMSLEEIRNSDKEDKDEHQSDNGA